MIEAPYRNPVDKDILEKMESTKVKEGDRIYWVNFGDHIDDMNFVKRFGCIDHPGYADWKWLNSIGRGPILFSDFFNWWKEEYKAGYYLVITESNDYKYIPYRGKIK